MKFLLVYGKQSLMFMPTEMLLIAYIINCTFSLSAGSIRKYVGALNHFFNDNIDQTGGQTFEARTKHYVAFRQTLKGITKTFGLARQIVQDAFPPELLYLLISNALDQGTADSIRFAAMLCMCVLGVRRLGDIMPFSLAEFDTHRHLTWSDIYFAPSGKFFVLRIKYTKTRGLLDEPLDFPIARQEDDNCVCALTCLEALQDKMMAQDPKLCGPSKPVFQSVVNGKFTGRPYVKDVASREIKARCTVLLKTAKHSFSGRSCRITGATMLMQLGVSGELISWLGDWRDTKHWRIYAHTPLPELLSLTQRISGAVKKAIGTSSHNDFVQKTMAQVE